MEHVACTTVCVRVSYKIPGSTEGIVVEINKYLKHQYIKISIVRSSLLQGVRRSTTPRQQHQKPVTTEFLRQTHNTSNGLTGSQHEHYRTKNDAMPQDTAMLRYCSRSESTTALLEREAMRTPLPDELLEAEVVLPTSEVGIFRHQRRHHRNTSLPEPLLQHDRNTSTTFPPPTSSSSDLLFLLVVPRHQLTKQPRCLLPRLPVATI